MQRWPTLRGVLLFFTGLAGEVVITVAWLNGTEPNQSLMLLFATMMGLPVFLQRDEQPPSPPPSDGGSRGIEPGPEEPRDPEPQRPAKRRARRARREREPEPEDPTWERS